MVGGFYVKWVFSSGHDYFVVVGLGVTLCGCFVAMEWHLWVYWVEIP